MTERRRVPPIAVSARFLGTEKANKATRALQKQLGLRPGEVSTVLAPGTVPDLGSRSGYMGITKVGWILVHARARDGDQAQAVISLMTSLGGEIVATSETTRATGGYGPTTAHGRTSVIGGTATTSAMESHRFTYEEPKPEAPKEP